MNLKQFKEKYSDYYIFESEKYTCAIKGDDVLGVYDNTRNFEWGQLDELSKQTMVDYIKSLRDKGHLSYNPKAKNKPRKDLETHVKRAMSRLLGDTRYKNKKPKPETNADKESALSETASVDTVTLDVPLMIRLFEHTREDIKDDAELHQLATSIIERSKTVTGALSMKDWKYIISGEKLEEKHAKKDQIPVYRADSPREVSDQKTEVEEIPVQLRYKQSDKVAQVVPNGPYAGFGQYDDGPEGVYSTTYVVFPSEKEKYTPFQPKDDVVKKVTKRVK